MIHNCYLLEGRKVHYEHFERMCINQYFLISINFNHQKALAFRSMVHQFVDKEKRRISSIPQEGITKESYRLIDTQCRWIRD